MSRSFANARRRCTRAIIKPLRLSMISFHWVSWRPAALQMDRWCFALLSTTWSGRNPLAGLSRPPNKVIDETGPKKKQLWVTGTLSSRARKELENRGWQVQEGSETSLLA